MLVVVSPNDQDEDAIEPSSLDVLVKVQDEPAVQLGTVKFAVGAALGAVTVTFLVAVFVKPPLSVTVRVTTYVPAAEKVLEVETPEPVVLSPKFQA